MRSGEYANRTRLTRNAVSEHWEGVVLAHAGSGSEDATVVLNEGTIRGVVRLKIATSSFTAADTFRVYKDTVATGDALTGTLGFVKTDEVIDLIFDEPFFFNAANVVVRINSTSAASITIMVQYHHD